MTNKLQLDNKLKELNYKIRKLEKERMTIRGFNHKTLLVNLKKQRADIERQLSNV